MGVTFDGSTDYYNLASPSITVPEFTMACWFNGSDVTTESRLMAIGNSASTSHEHSLWVASSKIAVMSRAGSSANAIHGTTLSTGTWYHGCGVWTAIDNRDIFLNGGTPVNNTTSKEPTGVNVLRVGREGRSTSTKMWTGDICYPAMWDVALLQDEVDALASGAHPTMIRPDRLVYFLPLETVSIFDPLGNVWTENGTPVESGDCPPVFYPSDPWVGVTAGGAPPAGLSIPIAMHHYKQLMGVN